MLFEEEEIEIPVFTKEKASTENVKTDRVKKEVSKNQDVLTPKVSPVKEVNIPSKNIKKEVREVKVQEDNERETFKSEPTFQFPVFDEKEFNESPKSRVVKNNTPKVKNKNIPKKIDFGRFEKPEPKEEPKHFVPSPVISPVYGILDKNYTKVDLQKKNNSISNREKVVDIDSIRNKAYGTLEEEIEQTIKTDKKEFYEEKPTKTINELLTEVIDEEIPVDEQIIDEENKKEREEKNIENQNTADSLNLLDTIEKEVKKDTNLDDTLESDLFNLIDSMYADREEEK